MKVGFTTLSMFMDDNLEIIKKAKEYDFDMIEILGESPFFKKNNTFFYNIMWTYMRSYS